MPPPQPPLWSAVHGSLSFPAVSTCGSSLCLGVMLSSTLGDGDPQKGSGVHSRVVPGRQCQPPPAVGGPCSAQAPPQLPLWALCWVCLFPVGRCHQGQSSESLSPPKGHYHLQGAPCVGVCRGTLSRAVDSFGGPGTAAAPRRTEAAGTSCWSTVIRGF